MMYSNMYEIENESAKKYAPVDNCMYFRLVANDEKKPSILDVLSETNACDNTHRDI